MALACLGVLAGCGSSGEGRETDSQKPRSAPAANSDKQSAGSTFDRVQDDGVRGTASVAEHQIEALRKAFPDPKPASGANQRVAAAIEAGKSACAGKTPIQVKDRAYAEAKHNLDEGQRRLAEELPDYEAEAERDPGFVAGQIAAGVYAATLPEATRPYGFQGCVYELARLREGELTGA
jgi:hypothetical protein